MTVTAMRLSFNGFLFLSSPEALWGRGEWCWFHRIRKALPSQSRTWNRPPKSSAVAPTLPASFGAVRRLLLVNSAQPVPSAQVISGPASVLEVPVVPILGSEANADSIHALGADEARDVSDTVSVEHDSNLRSVVPSEASSDPADEPGIRQAANPRGFSVGLAQLDGFHVTEIFERRAHVMRVVPHFMRAAFSSAMKAACEGILSGFSAGDLIRQERAWKLLCLLPRMLLCRPRRGGHVPKKELEHRLAMFISGNWQGLVSHSIHMSQQASQNLVRRGRHHNSDTLEAEFFGPRDSSSWVRFQQVAKHLRVHASHQARLQRCEL